MATWLDSALQQKTAEASGPSQRPHQHLAKYSCHCCRLAMRFGIALTLKWPITSCSTVHIAGCEELPIRPLGRQLESDAEGHCRSNRFFLNAHVVKDTWFRFAQHRHMHPPTSYVILGMPFLKHRSCNSSVKFCIGSKPSLGVKAKHSTAGNLGPNKPSRTGSVMIPTVPATR